MKSNTPRTDAQPYVPYDYAGNPYVSAEFARQLERENRELLRFFESVRKAMLLGLTTATINATTDLPSEEKPPRNG